MDDVWTVVHQERAALAEDLRDLTTEQWQTPSWCSEWTVHDVLAHLVATALTTRSNFVVNLARAGFDFDRFTARGVAAHEAPDPAQTLARFRAVSDRVSMPPAPLESRLVEAFVHGEDIRRPLGLHREYPVDQVVRAITPQAGVPERFGGGKNRVAGVALRADDTDFVLGDGPALTGPAVALLLALCGHRAALGELRGPGVEVLAVRP